MSNKLIPLAETPALLPPTATLGLGGMTLYRRPVAFVRALLHHTHSHTPSLPYSLTLLTFTASYESDLLVGAGLVKRIRTCYFGLEAFGLAPMFTQAANLRSTSSLARYSLFSTGAVISARTAVSSIVLSTLM